LGQKREARVRETYDHKVDGVTEAIMPEDAAELLIMQSKIKEINDFILNHEHEYDTLMS